MRRSPLLPLALALAAALSASCGSAPESTPRAPTSSPPAQPLPPGAEATLARICASAPCAGPFASIRVWRTAGGELGTYVFDGDLQRCSHPPRVYYDARGQQRAAVGEHPVEVGSEEDRQLTAQREALLRGLHEAERLSCP